MAKEKLTVVSSEPVSLDESTSKSTTDKSEPIASKAAGTVSDKESVQSQTKGQAKINDDDLEEVDVGGDTEEKAKDDKKDTSAEKTTDSESSAAVKPVPSGAAKDTASSTKSDSKTDATKATKDKNALGDSDAPPRPTRPVSPLEQIRNDLKDAFPQIEEKYIQACLIASDGRVDPAFNALLYLSDPSFKPEPVVATKQPVKGTKPQYTDDELLARQLQKEFDREERRRRSAAKSRQRPPSQDEEDESPDEIDQLKKEFSQGFEEAKSTINGWVSGLTKKFSQDDSGQSSAGSNPKLFGALGGSSFNSATKTRTKKFDEDPEILSSDFSRNVNLKDSEPPSLPRRSEKSEQENRWQPLNSDVPVSSDAFLVTDSEDEDRK